MSWDEYDYMFYEEDYTCTQYENVTLVHETKKARLFEIKNKKYWIPKVAHEWDEEHKELFVDDWFHMSEASRH